MYFPSFSDLSFCHSFVVFVSREVYKRNIPNSLYWLTFNLYKSWDFPKDPENYKSLYLIFYEQKQNIKSKAEQPKYFPFRFPPRIQVTQNLSHNICDYRCKLQPCGPKGPLYRTSRPSLSEPRHITSRSGCLLFF